MYLRYLICTKTLTNPREPESSIKDGCSWKTHDFQPVGSVHCSENQASTLSGAGTGTL